jgi:arsenite methyltransferase
MNKDMRARPRGSYGIDAPQLLGIPVVLVAYGVVQGVLTRQVWPFVGAALVVFFSGFGLYASRRGKFAVWDRLLDQLHLTGDEQVLDLGCGRGAVLMLVARRLTTGRAVGVDLWRKKDQAGNEEQATRRNAVAEGVADRVELHTADMTSLPFEDNSFDVVVSNVAMHNVKTRSGRDRAVEEAARVLRPGGRLLIADLRATNQYRERLAALGMTDIDRRNLGWRMWWSGPWLATYLVTATK